MSSGDKHTLVLNSGSSSLKFSLFTGASVLRVRSGELQGLGTHPHFVLKDGSGEVLEEKDWGPGARISYDEALEHLLKAPGLRDREIAAVVHRVVHGGVEFEQPVVVTDSVLEKLRALVPLAPLHQPQNLNGIDGIRKRLPACRQIACFDTAFHLHQPELASAIALPKRYTDRGIRRFGFHGISYQFIASQLSSFDARAAAGRTIVAHLGSGASMCALLEGKSIGSTMGFTPLDGLVMGTRPGNLDPGVLLYLFRHEKLDLDAIEDLLYHQSGLKGVSGISADMRTLLKSAEPDAKKAVDLFVYRAAREIGSLSAALGGLDAIVFTGGIGAGSAEIREKICQLSAWIGVKIDAELNRKGVGRLSAENSLVSAFVLPTDEELMMAQSCEALI